MSFIMTRIKIWIALFGCLVGAPVTIAQQKPVHVLTGTVDAYTAMVPINIRCTNDPMVGLACAADYPDQCKEQWNFPNPCSPENIAMNTTKFEHPFDKTKFLMCGDEGKLYVVQCPQFETFHNGCGQCLGEIVSRTASCETLLPETPSMQNPCTRKAILANKLFFAFPGNLTKFIHCDIWGKAWERMCTPGEVWSVWDTACVNPAHLNPCERQTNLTYSYGHPCNAMLYLQCDTRGRAYEISCGTGFAFHEESQRCLAYSEFPGQVLTSFCETYQFGFKQPIIPIKNDEIWRTTDTRTSDTRSTDIRTSDTRSTDIRTNANKLVDNRTSDTNANGIINKWDEELNKKRTVQSIPQDVRTSEIVVQDIQTDQRVMPDIPVPFGRTSTNDLRNGQNDMHGINTGQAITPQIKSGHSDISDLITDPPMIIDKGTGQPGIGVMKTGKIGISGIGTNYSNPNEIWFGKTGSDSLRTAQFKMNEGNSEQSFVSEINTIQNLTQDTLSGQIIVADNKVDPTNTPAVRTGKNGPSGNVTDQRVPDTRPSASQRGITMLDITERGLDSFGDLKANTGFLNRFGINVGKTGPVLQSVLDAQADLLNNASQQIQLNSLRQDTDSKTLVKSSSSNADGTQRSNVINDTKFSTKNSKTVSVDQKDIKNGSFKVNTIRQPSSGLNTIANGQQLSLQRPLMGLDFTTLLDIWASPNVELMPNVTDQTVNGKIVDINTIHPLQLKEYPFSQIPYSEPCTTVNIMEGRTHFRLLNDPHSFLQCDNAGRMHKMPCSTNSRDWFDVYTMTCVNGPIHVDNQVSRG